jgi:hypothetical protein
MAGWVQRGSRWLACSAAVGTAALLGSLALASGASSYLQVRAEALAPGSRSRALHLIAEALRLRPDRAVLWRDDAEWLTDRQLPGARAAVQAALRRDPQDWRSWQLLGQLDYEHNLLAQARSAFDHAARVDQGFAAHFQLANFALVIGDRRTFWRELKKAAAVATLDEVPFAVNQALAAARGPSDPHLMALVPMRRPTVVNKILGMYMAHGDYALAGIILEHLRCPTGNTGACAGATYDVVNTLMSAAFNPRHARDVRLATPARRLWNRAVAEGWVEPTQAPGNLCADGTFRHIWRGWTYSWQAVGPVVLDHSSQAPAGVAGSERIGFDGQEPEATPLFHQLVPVRPGAAYLISYWSRGTDMIGATGLALQVLTVASRALLTLPAGSAPGWLKHTGRFTVPSDITVVNLAFTYRRPSGVVRLNSPVLVTDVQVRGPS